MLVVAGLYEDPRQRYRMAPVSSDELCHMAARTGSIEIALTFTVVSVGEAVHYSVQVTLSQLPR